MAFRLLKAGEKQTAEQKARKEEAAKAKAKRQAAAAAKKASGAPAKIKPVAQKYTIRTGSGISVTAHGAAVYIKPGTKKKSQHKRPRQARTLHQTGTLH